MSALPKNFPGDGLFKQSGLMLSSSLAMNVFNLLFWIFMVRRLSLVDYGVLNSVVSLSMLFSLPLGIIQTVMTRYVSSLKAKNSEEEAGHLFWYFIKRIGVFLFIVLALIIAGAGSVSDFLRIRETAFVYVIGASLVFSSFAGMTVGVLTGLQDFGALALNNILTGTAKLFIGLLLVACGFGAIGAFLGFVFSFCVTAWLAWRRLPLWIKRRPVKPHPLTLDMKEIYRYFLPVILSTLCFFVLTNSDVILVKHFFSAEEAGHYSVAQMVGKIVLFISGAVGMVMFPKITEAHTKGHDPGPLLKKCLLIVGALSGGSAAVSCIFPVFVLKFLTGHVHPHALPLVKFFAANMAFFALVNILMLYHVSLHRMKFIYVMAVAAVAECAMIGMFHASLTQVLWVLLFCSAALFAFGWFHSFRGTGD